VKDVPCRVYGQTQSPRYMINVTLKDFGQRPKGRASIFVDRTRLKSSSIHRPKQAVLLRILLVHDFIIGKSRLWLAERAKCRGSHGRAPETGFKALAFMFQSIRYG
jgi:hypothetical protein